MSRNRVVKPVRFLWSLSALLALLMAVGNAQGHVSLGITYNLPTEELELDEDQAELIWRTLINWNVNYEKGIIAARKRHG